MMTLTEVILAASSVMITTPLECEIMSHKASDVQEQRQYHYLMNRREMTRFEMNVSLEETLQRSGVKTRDFAKFNQSAVAGAYYFIRDFPAHNVESAVFMSCLNALKPKPKAPL